jgi:hypothetical protein
MFLFGCSLSQDHRRQKDAAHLHKETVSRENDPGYAVHSPSAQRPLATREVKTKQMQAGWQGGNHAWAWRSKTKSFRREYHKIIVDLRVV